MKFVHANIISQDWKRLADFYIRVFQCTPVPPERDQSGEWLDRGTGLTQAHLRGAHLRLPGWGDNGPTLEIYQYDQMESKPESVANRQGLGHIAFEVEDLKETVDSILKHGGSLCGEIVEKQIDGVGLLTFSYVKDPEGNLIEIQNWR